MAVAVQTAEPLWFLDTLHTVRVSHDQGEDGISVLEALAPYGDSPPLHVHRTEDELFHVLEGGLRLRVGDADARIGAGESLLAPKGVAHTYRVESADGARWLVVTTGGRFERFVRELSRPAERPGLPTPQGPPTPEQADALAAAARRHGIELIGPPLHAYPSAKTADPTHRARPDLDLEGPGRPRRPGTLRAGFRTET